MTSTRKTVCSEPLTGGSLTPAQVAQWRTQGFLLLRDVLPADVTAAAAADIAAAFPRPTTPNDYKEVASSFDFGSEGDMCFPTTSPAVNSIVLHPTLTTAACELMGCRGGCADLRISQAEAWPKYGPPAEAVRGQRNNQDQRMHIDMPNHCLVYPPDWHTPNVVSMIVYLSNVEDCDGQTAVVPRNGDDDPAYGRLYMTKTPGFGAIPWINDRATAEEYLKTHYPEIASFREQLYEREVLAQFKIGDVLLYRHDIWHRGTPVRPLTTRYALNLVYKLAGQDWIHQWAAGFAKKMYRSDQLYERLVATSSVDQRSLMGFPPPGHPYWTAESLEAVTLRYGPFGFDPTPYQTF